MEKFTKDQWENGDSATRESLAKALRVYAMDNPDKESNDKPSNKNFKASILCPRKSQVCRSLSLDAWIELDLVTENAAQGRLFPTIGMNRLLARRRK